jgi:hypothetical protein
MASTMMAPSSMKRASAPCLYVSIMVPGNQVNRVICRAAVGFRTAAERNAPQQQVPDPSSVHGKASIAAKTARGSTKCEH